MGFWAAMPLRAPSSISLRLRKYANTLVAAVEVAFPAPELNLRRAGLWRAAW
jgi:hypothetical protein